MTLEVLEENDTFLLQLSGMSGQTGDQIDVTKTADKPEHELVGVLMEGKITFLTCPSVLVFQRRQETVRQVW